MISAGSHHSCARRASGAVACWGQNAAGEFGNGGTTWSNTPVAAMGVTNAVAVVAGEQHTCVELVSGSVGGGQVLCSGRNDLGQLGNGTTSTSATTTPTTTIGLP